MPPIFYKAPLAVPRKVPKGRILPLSSPDIRLGKCLITLTPRRIKAESLEKLRFALKRILNRQKERNVDVHATYAVTQNPEGVKMGQGKGKIHHYVARVPAGYPIVHLPQLKPLVGTKEPLFWGSQEQLEIYPRHVALDLNKNQFDVDNVSLKSNERITTNLNIQRKLLRLRFSRG